MTFKERYTYHTTADFLGKGGFATVYKAYDNLLKRTVALKFFKNEGEKKYNLINEISHSINLVHPNICRYYDVAILEIPNVHGGVDTVEVGIMEYLDAGTIKDYIQKNPAQLNKLLIDVLNGLSFLHSKNVIHRDIKPGNILIQETAEGPVAKITDFGISKLLEEDPNSSSKILGSVGYMAPEQFDAKSFGENGKISTKVDIWAFGAMLYELQEKKQLFENISANDSGKVILEILNFDIAEKTKRVQEPYKTILNASLNKYAQKRFPANELTPLFTVNDLEDTKPIVFKKEEVILPKKKIHLKWNKKSKIISFSILFSLLSFTGYLIYRVDKVVNNTAFKRLGIYNSIIASFKYDYVLASDAPLIEVQIRNQSGSTLEKAGLINDNGKVIVPLGEHNFSDYAEGLYVYYVYGVNKKAGFIDSLGDIKIPLKYEDAKSFRSGLAAVKLNGKWGLIDKKETVVTEFIYDDISGYFDYENKMEAKIGNRTYYLTTSGKQMDNIDTPKKESNNLTPDKVQNNISNPSNNKAENPSNTQKVLKDESYTSTKDGVNELEYRFSNQIHFENQEKNWVTLKEINFDLGRAQTTVESEAIISKIANFLKTKNAVIKIGVFASKGGDENSNIKLTAARAEHIKNKLVHTYNIEQYKMVTEGYGSAYAKYEQGDKNAALDRVVKIKIMAF
jgi:serine/threonine protein kinase/outer membrane protein OmpA-like peptidoglycan-associated protein